MSDTITRKEKPMHVVRYQGNGDWSALYVDGKLVQVGDHYLIDEKISELLGVTVEYSDDFLQGQTLESGIAQTLEDAQSYETIRLQKEREIHLLEEQREELLRQLNNIDQELNGSSPSQSRDVMTL